MKRKIALVLLMILTVALSGVMLIACADANSPEKIDQFFEQMTESDSGTITMVISMGSYGTYSQTTKIEGNKSYVSAFMGAEPYFTETVDGYIYTYKKVGSSWVKDEGVAETGDLTGIETLVEMFNGDNYLYSAEKQCYVMKDNVIIDFSNMAISNGQIALEEDTCTFSGIVTEEGMSMSIAISISKVGSTTVTLPEVAA